jgi:GT2 family glycosyltransferase
MTTAPALPVPPARIVDLDLDHPEDLRAPGGAPAPAAEGPVLALVRRSGHPLGLVTASGTAGGPALRTALLDAARRDVREDLAGRAPQAATPAGPEPTVTVVVCTRDRTDLLTPCLDSLLRSAPPQAEVLLVDNAPTDRTTRDLVRSRYADRIRYLHEPVPGLARARNTALAAATGEIIAFTDDDALADPGWVPGLIAAFRADDRIACVTGLVLPAELDTPSQAAFERHCGFSRGFTARTWSLAAGADDPLFPYTTSRFGTGANMAFRVGALRAIGGFDRATGAGTPTRGGEDLLAFLDVLTAGHTVAYQPDALIWHRHRRTPEALDAQVYGFGVGYGAYLTAAVLHRPALLGGLLRRLPRALPAAARGGRAPDRPAPRALARRQLRGLLYGPFSYLVSLRRQRTLDAGTLP